jgi:hypothetical protein
MPSRNQRPPTTLNTNPMTEKHRSSQLFLINRLPNELHLQILAQLFFEAGYNYTEPVSLVHYLIANPRAHKLLETHSQHLHNICHRKQGITGQNADECGSRCQFTNALRYYQLGEALINRTEKEAYQYMLKQCETSRKNKAHSLVMQKQLQRAMKTQGEIEDSDLETFFA